MPAIKMGNSKTLRTNSQDFLNLFLNDTPMLDVRAPVEFLKGAFPNSQNIPLLDNQQREVIGTMYKKEGQNKAIELGHTLATAQIKEARLAQWTAFIQNNGNGYLYCFRGGLRSKMTQVWLKESGIDYPFIEGGYKAMRTFLLEELDKSLNTVPIVLVSGRTASGKTHFLHRLKNMVDLEGLANHRGSSFGALISPQPSQIDFENQISIELLKHKHQHKSPVFMEDEGRLIGQLAIPPYMRKTMTEQYPIIVLESTMPERVKVGVKDYITDLYPLYESAHGDHAHDIFSEKILHNLSRIQKRLGGELYQQLQGQFKDALTAMKTGQVSGFSAPIETLLSKYYDPMYDYQLSKRQGRVLIRGDQEELLAWSQTYQATATELAGVNNNVST